jgi:hypothetical protein
VNSEIERIPRRIWFLPDFHNSAHAYHDGDPGFSFVKLRENRAPKDASPIPIFRVAQKFGMSLWTSCTRLKTGEIKLRKNC